jgi:hypothetical protein
LGTPDDADVSFVTDEKAIMYLKSFKSIHRLDWTKKYPGASQESIDLLDKML